MNAQEFLPRVLAEIAAVAGRDAALAVAAARGGTQVYIPPEPPADHWLSQLLGQDAAKAVADRLNGGIPTGVRVDLPLGPVGYTAQMQAIMRGKIREMLANDMSERDIAMATRYTTRTIRRHRAAMRDDRQMSLFD